MNGERGVNEEALKSYMVKINNNNNNGDSKEIGSQPMSIGRVRPSLILPTVDGYTVSHSFVVDHLPTDSYGFILDDRFSVNEQNYREFELEYAPKLERQAVRWKSLLITQKESVAVFPPSSDKTKKALRKGLPRELRAQAWYYYSGAQSLHESEPRKYIDLVKRASRHPSGPLLGQIDSDVSHTFANNRGFRTMNIHSPFPKDCSQEPAAYAALRRILLALVTEYPSVNYVGGLSLVGATLLLITQDEVRSFWIFVSLVTKKLPENYYSDMNLGCNVDQDVLISLLAWKLPAIHSKLQDLEISLHIITSTWFINLFVDQLRFETLLRVWDCFLHEGSKVLFRIAFSLFKLNQNHIMAINDSFELAAFIRNMPRRQLDAVTLMQVAFEGLSGFSREWLEKERARIMPSWKARHSVRRFSRVSPAYCTLSNRSTPSSNCSPLHTSNPPIINDQDLDNDEDITFDLPEEICVDSCASSIASVGTAFASALQL